MMELRKERGKSRGEIAEVISVSSRTYAYYEKGQRDISIENALKLATYYGISMDLFLGREHTYVPDELLKDVNNVIHYCNVLVKKLEY